MRSYINSPRPRYLPLLWTHTPTTASSTEFVRRDSLPCCEEPPGLAPHRALSPVQGQRWLPESPSLQGKTLPGEEVWILAALLLCVWLCFSKHTKYVSQDKNSQQQRHRSGAARRAGVWGTVLPVTAGKQQVLLQEGLVTGKDWHCHTPASASGEAPPGGTAGLR